MVRLLLCLIILGGCASQSRKDQDSLRRYFVQKDFSKAEQYLESSSLKKEENKLLYLMDKGTLAYYQERYFEAAKVFNEANELVDRLYTKSVRELIASSIINDNTKTFYGSIFERSMLYYYKAMSFYQLAKKGSYQLKIKKEKGEEIVTKKLSPQGIKRNLDRVRSSLIAWNGFYDEMKQLRGAKTFLKDDYASRFYAATIHEALGTRKDLEIAFNLYKEVYDNFKLYAPTYKIFNDKFKEYNGELRDYFDKKIKKKAVKSRVLTKRYKETENYLKFKILDMAKKVRPSQYKRIGRKLKPTGYNYEEANVLFQIEAKTINPTKGKDYVLNLRTAIDEIEDPNKKALINGIGVPILTAFAFGTLGLGYASHHGNVTVYHRHGAGEALAKEIGIEFELPDAEPNTDKIYDQLILKQGEAVVETVSLAPINSLSDIAFVNAQERVSNSFNKRAARVGVKYALAILAAYTTYKQMEEKNGLLAGPIAAGQYLLSQKAIKESEKADVRHWTTLPNLILSARLKLSPGSYKVYLKTEKTEKYLDDLVVEDSKKAIFTHRVF